MEELKPCPFCGGKAILRKYTDGRISSFTVRCENMCVVTCSRRDAKVRWRPTLKREAVETWNRRANDG